MYGGVFFSSLKLRNVMDPKGFEPFSNLSSHYHLCQFI